MDPYHLGDDQALDLDLFFAFLRFWNAHPVLAVLIDEDYFKFAGAEEVADDEVVVVAFEGLSAFFEEERGVGFKLPSALVCG